MVSFDFDPSSLISPFKLHHHSGMPMMRLRCFFQGIPGTPKAVELLHWSAAGAILRCSYPLEIRCCYQYTEWIRSRGYDDIISQQYTDVISLYWWSSPGQSKRLSCYFDDIPWFILTNQSPNLEIWSKQLSFFKFGQLSWTVYIYLISRFVVQYRLVS